VTTAQPATRIATERQHVTAFATGAFVGGQRGRGEGGGGHLTQRRDGATAEGVDIEDRTDRRLVAQGRAEESWPQAWRMEKIK
jgi:hypothetical protein